MLFIQFVLEIKLQNTSINSLYIIKIKQDCNYVLIRSHLINAISKNM